MCVPRKKATLKPFLVFGDHTLASFLGVNLQVDLLDVNRNV